MRGLLLSIAVFLFAAPSYAQEKCIPPPPAGLAEVVVTDANDPVPQVCFRPSFMPEFRKGERRWIDSGTDCAIRDDHTLWCKGLNTFGQLGNGTLEDNDELREVAGGGQWKFTETQWGVSCGIKSDDTLWCWGQNSECQLGNGSVENSMVPVEVSGGGSWKAVSVELLHTCGIKEDDTLWCWGLDIDGQNRRPAPNNIPGNWKQISTGDLADCGIKNDDTLWCNGSDLTGVSETISSAFRKAFDGSWKHVSMGGVHGCAIKSDDTLWCWGGNSMGELGRKTEGELYGMYDIGPVLPGSRWKTVASGAQGVCAIRSDDTLWCWAEHDITDTFLRHIRQEPERERTVPVQVFPGVWKKVTAGEDMICALKDDGTEWCWGLLWFTLPVDDKGNFLPSVNKAEN